MSEPGLPPSADALISNPPVELPPPPPLIPVDPLPFSSPMIQPLPFPPEKRPRSSGRQKREPRMKTLPSELDRDSLDGNGAYSTAMADPSQSISPQALGFMPSSYWLNTSISFGDLVTKFFHRKNNSSCRFPHKLFNALLIVDRNESMFDLIGVKWVDDAVFVVDKLVFGRLLGISCFDGGLFHRQGNFPSHGFVEVPIEKVHDVQIVGFDPVLLDFDRFRLMTHSSGLFKASCSEEFFNDCKWVNL